MAKEKKVKEKKPIPKAKIATVAVWSAVVVFVVVCFVLNICFASKDDANANLLTAFSGWFAFLATIGVAYFAFYSDRKNKQQAEVQRLVDRIENDVKKVDDAKTEFAKQMPFAILEDEMTMLHEMWGHKTEIWTMLTKNAIYKRVDFIDLLLKDAFASPIFYEYRKEALGAVADLNQFLLEYARIWDKNDNDRTISNMIVLGTEYMQKYKEQVKKTLMLLMQYSMGANSFLNSLITLSYKEFIKRIDEAKAKCLEIDKELLKNHINNNPALAAEMQGVLPKID